MQLILESASIKSTSFNGYAPLLMAQYLNLKKKANITISVGLQTSLIDQSTNISGPTQIVRYLAREYCSEIYNQDPLKASQIDYWIDFGTDHLSLTDFSRLSETFNILDSHLRLRSYFVGYNVKLADISIWSNLKSNSIFSKHLKSNNPNLGKNLVRWFEVLFFILTRFNHISALDFVIQAQQTLEKAKEDQNKSKKDQGSFDIGLKEAVMGQVVTRFPPEPSGYLHIGHAKAALLNDYFAKEYQGKLIVRFDDTNPSKEKSEFENSIQEDLLLIGIKGDVVTHTSDHFDELFKYAISLIKMGLAYVDDTDGETMRSERMVGTESKNRNKSVQDNLAHFSEMAAGTEFGLKCCLRAKIDMKAKNKTLCDPVIYRTNLQPHHRTGTTWKIYPTYDFACPLVDSIEGVTHALRTNEYRDRNAQYEWFLKTLSLRWVHIWDFSRINFVYTLLSKRKLAWFVEKELVSGWDDPRFPTVRGVRRRGMTIEALRTYILMQGASQKDLLLEWDKIWALNKKVIDPISPRYSVINANNMIKVSVLDYSTAIKKQVPLHKKFPELGTKEVSYSPTFYLEQDDFAVMESGEEVTLMDWGNAFIEPFERDANGIVQSASIKLHLQGDFKKTKKKITWISEPVPVTLFDYDYLITKKKLEEQDQMADFITKETLFVTHAMADRNIISVKKGDIIQFERKGYFICDQNTEEARQFILIPDGKEASMKSKAAN